MMTEQAGALTLEDILDRLEALAVELERADPDDLDRMAVLIDLRAEHIAQACRALEANPHAAAPATQLARAVNALENGARLEERLRLARAGLRFRLRELHALGFRTRALASGELANSSQFSLEA